MQGCTDSLVPVFSNYELNLDTVEDATKFLDLFGDIESDYKCSGICAHQGVYYFSSITAGEPEIDCTDKIKHDLFRGTIRHCGYLYLIVGKVMLFIWLLQYGLWCRRTNKQGKSK